MLITLTDTERALILENCRMQLHAMGHVPTICFYLDCDEAHAIISIQFDFCIFSIGYTFNEDGSTVEDINFRVGDAGWIEKQTYQNDTRAALVDRLVTCDYSFWPDPKESQRLQDEYEIDRTNRLKNYLKSWGDI